jgi:ribose/xylose/arabinose/galactoside ABC-type transport system permease subunit
MKTVNLGRINLKTLGYFFQKFSAVIILLSIIVIMSIGSSRFFRVQNFLNILSQSSVLGIISIGMTFVIVTGGIDLSVGSTMALSASVMAVGVTQWGLSPVIAIIFGILIGIFVGILNGLIVTIGKIQPFIATLGTVTAVQGIALLVTTGLPISGMPEGMLVLGRMRAGVIPPSLYVFAVVAVLGWIIFNRMVLGRNAIAIGGNEEASKTAGIKTNLTKVLVYALSGFCCSIAGLVIMGRLRSSNALMGTGFELQAITAVALGGTSMAGGVGTISGTIIGILTIGVLNNGLDLMNITPFWQKVILGLIIIAVVVMDSWRRRRFND